MGMKRILGLAVTYLAYPILLGTTLLTIHATTVHHIDLKRALWGYLLGLLAVLITLERLFPLSPRWSMTRVSFRQDLKYLLSSGVTIALLRAGFGAIGIWYSEHHHGPLASASLPVSLAVFFLVFEFLQYWFHRMSHEGHGRLGRFLWKAHVVHHLPDRVYVVMHGVFHPLNAFISALLIQASMLLLGLSPQAVFAATLLIDLQTMISHFNVDIRAGFFNYLFIGTELHRYHHSSAVTEAKNYGTVLPLWDLVFGTFRYRPGTDPSGLGVSDPSEYPPLQRFWQVLALPFRASAASATVPRASAS